MGHKGEIGQTKSVFNFSITNAVGLFDMHENIDRLCIDHQPGNYEGALY